MVVSVCLFVASVHALEILAGMITRFATSYAIHFSDGCIVGLVWLGLLWISWRQDVHWTVALSLFVALCLIPPIGVYFRNIAFRSLVFGEEIYFATPIAFTASAWSGLRGNLLSLVALSMVRDALGIKIVSIDNSPSSRQLSVLHILIATVLVATLVSFDMKLHAYFTSADYPDHNAVANYDYGRLASMVIAYGIFGLFTTAGLAWSVFRGQHLLLLSSVLISLQLRFLSWFVTIEWDTSRFWNGDIMMSWIGYVTTFYFGCVLLRRSGLTLSKTSAAPLNQAATP